MSGSGQEHGRDDAVAAFRRSAFWNLRTRIANVAIVVGALALLTVSVGGASGARLAPTLVCAVAGACGAGVYLSRPYPAVARWLLIAAVSLTALGLGWLAVVTAMGS
jgi:hypothetical protein